MKKNSTRFIKIFTLFLLIFLFHYSNAAQVKSNPQNTAGKYSGTLKETLIPDTRELYYQLFQPFSESSNKKTLPNAEKNALITAGFVFDPRNSEKRHQVFLIESQKENPYICSDENSDGKIDKKECRTMIAVSENPDAFEQTLLLPLSQSIFKSYPIYLRLRRDMTSPNLKKGGRIMQQSSMALAVGNVKIGEREIYAGYEFNITEPPVNSTKGMLLIDVNGDGKFDNRPFSNESAYASDDETVFRIDDLYFSTEKLDPVTKQIVMRLRQKNEYKRQEFEIGKEIADFSFTDFDNKDRSLSEFRGKYLLIDFWGVWCVDCRKEIPFQLEAYKLFRSRGLEILGMNTDEDPEKTGIYLAENNIIWTQTKFESIKELVEKKYGIQQYPSTLLIGKDGKVLVLDQEKLKGNELIKTLDQILPR